MSDDIRAAIRERDKLLRDAYHGRNGLSMSKAERERYRAMMERVRAAKRIARGNP